MDNFNFAQVLVSQAFKKILFCPSDLDPYYFFIERQANLCRQWFFFYFSVSIMSDGNSNRLFFFNSEFFYVDEIRLELK
jgi:hypothetical protein